MPRFNLKHIEAFVLVADLGSFRRAAARLNTTQPNISNRISQLEQHIGQVLMERDAGSVRLTREGRALLEPARRVLASVDAFAEAAGGGAAFEGVLRLGVTELVAQTWLRRFLLRMKRDYPAIDVELTVDLSENLSSALFSRDLDLTFQNGPFDRKARFTEALGRCPHVWVSAQRGDIPEGPLSSEIIARHRIFTHARGTYPFQQLDNHFKSVGQGARLVPSSNVAAALHMTQDGLGIACVPELMAQEPLDAGRLRRLDYDWRPEALRFAARWNTDPTPPFLRDAVALAVGFYPPQDK